MTVTLRKVFVSYFAPLRTSMRHLRGNCRATTWALVRIVPLVSSSTPVPLLATLSIPTMLGLTRSNTVTASSSSAAWAKDAARLARTINTPKARRMFISSG